MITTSSMTTRRCLALNLCVALIVVGLEAHFYPALATLVHSLAGGSGGPGSSMGYFRDSYVVPAALAFALFMSASLVIFSRKSHRLFHRVVIGLWILNSIAVVASSLWYFHVIGAASGAGSP